ncbi:MAG: hypothetical protein JWO86_641 [Myxococcaceae bacterium]|nr:hypothetical protein [Myxococcaceae bacterium]
MPVRTRFALQAVREAHYVIVMCGRAFTRAKP